jgi:hypothetical protein
MREIMDGRAKDRGRKGKNIRWNADGADRRMAKELKADREEK